MVGAPVYVSHAPEDASWARGLAEQLEREGLSVFSHERDMAPGDVEIRRVDELIGTAGTAILVLGAAAMADPRLTDEYAAFLREGWRRGLRIIPVLHGDGRIEVAPLAGTRLWVDLRELGPTEYQTRVRQLAGVIRDERRWAREAVDEPAPPAEVWDAVRPAASPRPVEVASPAFVVTYAREDSEYGGRLVGWLTRAGLPVWSIADLVWGSRFVQEIRQRLRNALAVIVLMSPAAEESEDLEREILEGQRHDREFFPVLLRGDRSFLLASSWYFDARDGGLPGTRELRRLRRIYDLHTGSGSAAAPQPRAEPPVQPTARSAPGLGDGLSKLRSFLREEELAHADLLTTSLLLGAVGRLDSGWLRPADGPQLPDSLLAAIDAAWSDYTGATQGFRQQQRLHLLQSVRRADLSALELAYGWRAPAASGPTFGELAAMERYGTFVDRAASRAGFFPTLRNPQVERYPSWYDRWRKTVVAVHRRLQTWKDEK